MAHHHLLCDHTHRTASCLPPKVEQLAIRAIARLVTGKDPGSRAGFSAVTTYDADNVYQDLAHTYAWLCVQSAWPCEATRPAVDEKFTGFFNGDACRAAASRSRADGLSEMNRHRIGKVLVDIAGSTEPAREYTQVQDLEKTLEWAVGDLLRRLLQGTVWTSRPERKFAELKDTRTGGTLLTKEQDQICALLVRGVVCLHDRKAASIVLGGEPTAVVADYVQRLAVSNQRREAEALLSRCAGIGEQIDSLFALPAGAWPAPKNGVSLWEELRQYARLVLTGSVDVGVSHQDGDSSPLLERVAAVAVGAAPGELTDYERVELRMALADLAGSGMVSGTQLTKVQELIEDLELHLGEDGTAA